MTAAIGRTRWAIAEGYIPSRSTGPEPQMTSHETACILNTSDRDAHVRITVFFADREPVGPYSVTVPARRTKHVRFNELEDPEPDRPTHVELHAEDVIHSFFLPDFRVMQDAVPGMEMMVWFQPTRTGEFVIGCAELCGIGHTRMRGTLTVHSAADYQTWVNEQLEP